jgi:hypothetical protein
LNTQNPLDSLKDIKPIIEIPDYSFYILCLLATVGVLLLIAIIYNIYKYFKSIGKTPRDISLKILKNIDFQNPKDSAYAITHHGKIVATDHRSQKVLKDLNIKLENYKYKKNVKEIDSETKKEFQLFLEVVEQMK